MGDGLKLPDPITLAQPSASSSYPEHSLADRVEPKTDRRRRHFLFFAHFLLERDAGWAVLEIE